MELLIVYSFERAIRIGIEFLKRVWVVVVRLMVIGHQQPKGKKAMLQRYMQQ